MYIKICGITRKEDRDAALNAGVSALGFITYPKSPRYITPEMVKELVQDIPSSIDKVGVFVNESIETIRSYIDAGITIVQLHGKESEEAAQELSKLGVEIWKAMALQSDEDIEQYTTYPADKYLIDAYCGDAYGGLGKVADWDLAEKAVSRFNRPVLLAGGLKENNVRDAIAKVKPFGIDLSSGVEESPGIKDHALIQSFIAKVNGTTT